MWVSVAIEVDGDSTVSTVSCIHSLSSLLAMLSSQASASYVVNTPSIPSSGYKSDSVARSCGSIVGSDCCVSSGWIIGVAQSSMTDGVLEVPIVISSEGARVPIDVCV